MAEDVQETGVGGDPCLGLAPGVLEALARNASPVALYWLDVWASIARSKGLRARADEGLDRLAEELGVSRAALVSRARPPRLGFSIQGERTLSVAGGHRVELALAPGGVEVSDATTGAALKWRSLSRKLGKAAAEELKPLRKAIDRSLELAAGMLERAMIADTAWAWDEFRAMVHGHPMVRAVAPGTLVQIERDGSAELVAIGAGGVLHGEDGAEVEVSEGRLRVPHRLSLDDAAADAWRATLASLGLSPAFEQLEREVFAPDPAVKDPFAARLKKGAGRHPARGLMTWATKMGYQPGRVEDAGFFYDFSKRLGEHVASIHHTGMPIDLSYADDVTISGYGVADASGAKVAAGALPPVLFSEAMRDLERLV